MNSILPYGLENQQQFDAIKNQLSNQGFDLGTDGSITNTKGLMGAINRIGGLDGLGDILGGVQGIGNMFLAMKQLGMAKDQYKFQRQAYNTNLTNQKKTYNTALEDRARSRTAYEGGSMADMNAYLDKHRL